MWSIRCEICGAEIDSFDSYADTKAMLRDHMDFRHPKPENDLRGLIPPHHP